MAEEEQYTELDMSEIMGDSEHQIESENQLTEYVENTETETIEDSEVITSAETVSEKRSKEPARLEAIRTTKLPLARIKHIIKMDPDVNLVNAEAVFLIAKATELFLETLAKEAHAVTATKKKKTMTKKDLDHVVDMVDCLCFLEGAMDF